jgi:hypothetical protein
LLSVFIKGGILYYEPFKEPLNALTTTITDEKKLQHHSLKIDEFDEFSSEFITCRQFANLIDLFCMPLFIKSEICVNDMIVYLKNNFCESLSEKSKKIETVNIYRRKNVFCLIFFLIVY